MCVHIKRTVQKRWKRSEKSVEIHLLQPGIGGGSGVSCAFHSRYDFSSVLLFNLTAHSPYVAVDVEYSRDKKNLKINVSQKKRTTMKTRSQLQGISLSHSVFNVCSKEDRDASKENREKERENEEKRSCNYDVRYDLMAFIEHKATKETALNNVLCCKSFLFGFGLLLSPSPSERWSCRQ